MKSRDYNKELSDQLVGFRAKCSELNLVNAEFAAANEASQAIYRSYLDANRIANEVGGRLTEIRSELQAMQAKMLDSLIEHMTNNAA